MDKALYKCTTLLFIVSVFSLYFLFVQFNYRFLDCFVETCLAYIFVQWLKNTFFAILWPRIFFSMFLNFGHH